MPQQDNLVLKVLQNLSLHPMKVKELAQALGIPEPDYARFKKVIKQLLESGELIHLKRNRLGLASEMNMAVGEISITRGGIGFVPREGFDDVMIPSANLLTALDGDRVMVRIGGVRGERQTGAVARVLKRADRNIVGVYHEGRDFAFVRADNPRIHREIYVAKRSALGAKDGEKVVSRLLAWDDPHLNPEGEIIERLGRPGDPGVDMMTVIRSFDLPLEFAEAVLAEAEKAAVLPSRDETIGRQDFSGECIYTIDPSDAKDHDDAISVTRTDHGYRLGVHIADVAHYVRPGSVLDSEAFRRGNSVYLPGMVVPMLPEVLSNDVCSLKPNRRRLAHSVLIDFDPKGKMTGWQLVDAVIVSRARLSYEQVQEFFNTGKAPDAKIARVADNLLLARELANLVSRRRLSAGSLDFDLPEAKIVLNEKGEVLELGSRVRLEAHRLIEEFMLAANQAVALEVFRHAQPFLYRVHGRPSMERMEEFSAMMKRLGYHFPVSPELQPVNFARFLESVRDKPEAEFINELMLRSMQKATYQLENIGHFGLAFTHYTHFTSPIRRYPDLLVHRLVRQLKGGHYPAEYARRVVSVITNVGSHCSETERMAEAAERQAIKVKQTAFMARQVGQEYTGVISGVISAGFFVRLSNMGAEGMVRLSSLDDDYYVLDEKQYRLVGRRTGRVFRMGDAVEVGIMRVDTARQEIELFLVEAKEPRRPAQKREKKPQQVGRPTDRFQSRKTRRGRGRKGD
jgi:ribonuclease R